MPTREKLWTHQWPKRIAPPLLVLTLFCETAAAQCCGDCNGDGRVSINELVTAVNDALEGCTERACCGDCRATGKVTIDDLISAVGQALAGCPTPMPSATAGEPTPVPTDTPPEATPVSTATPTEPAPVPTATTTEPSPTPTALCAPGEVEVTFAIAASEDDGAVTAFSRAPYPPTALDAQTEQSAGSPNRSRLGANFSIQVNLFRWATPFPAEAAFTAAYLRFFTPSYLENIDADDRNLTADWYDWSDNGGADPSDYTEAAETNALTGYPIRQLGGSGEWNVVRLDNTDGVVRNGATHLRLHVSGGEPTAINGAGIEHWDDARDNPAELIVCQQN